MTAVEDKDPSGSPKGCRLLRSLAQAFGLAAALCACGLAGRWRCCEAPEPGPRHFVLVPLLGYFQVTRITAPALAAAALLLGLLVALLRGGLGRLAQRAAAVLVLVAALALNPFLQYLADTVPVLASTPNEYGCESSHEFFQDVGMHKQVPRLVEGLLTPEEAAGYAARIKARPEHLIHISKFAGPLPFFTYGPYWMYDSRAYNGHAARARVYLEEFAPLHEKVRAGLEALMDDGPVTYLPNSSKPAFHVLYSHFVFQYRVFKFHYDEMVNNMAGKHGFFRGFDLKNECEADSRISFTLPLALPRAPCGLDHYHFPGRPGCEPTVDCVGTCLDLMRVDYKVGSLIVHSGRMLHQIGPWAYYPLTDMFSARITLQGFGIRCRGKWYIYW
mmetsp:Transcript_90266/g.255573  ORF Transcript_90266/g.255573 Transcript_90266/m.255573 type:complete len:388 (-) Transcript_90266:140-1303(-)